MNAVIYARVSSREQEREGYSIPAQRKLLSEYARKTGFSVKREFVDVESAKNPGRKEFGNMRSMRERNCDSRCCASARLRSRSAFALPWSFSMESTIACATDSGT